MDARARRVRPLAQALEMRLEEFPTWTGVYEEDVRALNVFKERLERQRRVLAKRYHPDVIGGDGARLTAMNALIDRLLQASVPGRVPRVQVIVQGFQWTFTTHPDGTWTDRTTTAS